MNAGKMEEIKNKRKVNTQIDGHMQPRKCSYYKCMLEDCDDHNIRTCTKILGKGKSPYTEYSEGKFKLLYVKGISSEEVEKQYSIFTYQENENDVENTTNMDRQSVTTSINERSNISLRVSASHVDDCEKKIETKKQYCNG